MLIRNFSGNSRPQLAIDNKNKINNKTLLISHSVMNQVLLISKVTIKGHLLYFLKAFIKISRVNKLRELLHKIGRVISFSALSLSLFKPEEILQDK